MESIPGIDNFYWREQSDGSSNKILGPWYWKQLSDGNFIQVPGIWCWEKEHNGEYNQFPKKIINNKNHP